MASGLKMLVLGVMWLTNIIILGVYVIVSSIIMRTLGYLQGLGIPMGSINYNLVQEIFPWVYVLVTAILIVMSYRLYQEIASDSVYQPGY